MKDKGIKGNGQKKDKGNVSILYWDMGLWTMDIWIRSRDILGQGNLSSHMDTGACENIWNFTTQYFVLNFTTSGKFNIKLRVDIIFEMENEN